METINLGACEEDKCGMWGEQEVSVAGIVAKPAIFVPQAWDLHSSSLSICPVDFQ